MTYEATGNALIDRIEALIPEHPEILTMTNAFDLFKCGLECDDLQPSFAQASMALGIVRHRHERKM